MGQNSSQCGCKGVKHDQTTLLNSGIMVPKMWAGEREMGAEREWLALLSYLVTYSLHSAGTVKHSLMHSLDVWTFVHGPHGFARKTKRDFARQTIAAESCRQILPSVLICTTLQAGHWAKFSNLHDRNENHRGVNILELLSIFFFPVYSDNRLTFFSTPSLLCMTLVLAPVFSATNKESCL